MTMSKKGNGNGNLKKPPQFARIGDGFPVPIKAMFDLLSPAPIDGIRIPLMDLYQKIHEMVLGVSRLGPLTADQIASDLKAPYSTLAGNMLMMGARIAFAQMEFEKQQAFNLQRSEVLKSLREYFDLKQLEILDFRLSSGKIPEPADPGIPFSPDKYPPQQLEQMTKDLAKLALTTSETLERHQKEWENFNSSVSRQVLAESPSTEKINNVIKEIYENTNRSEEFKKHIAGKIQKADDKIADECAENIKKFKPSTEKGRQIREASHAEKEGEPVKLVYAPEGLFAELNAVGQIAKAEMKRDELHEAGKITATAMKDDSITDERVDNNLDEQIAKVFKESQDSMISPSIAKKHAAVSRAMKKTLVHEQQKTINELDAATNKLVKKMSQADKEVGNAPNKDH